jgi:hypothetical protein
MCTKKGEMEVRWGPKNEVSPSSANLYELVPPSFTVPIPQLKIAIVAFLEHTWSTEIEYIEKGIIIQDVDRCRRLSNDRTSDLDTSCT